MVSTKAIPRSSEAALREALLEFYRCYRRMRSAEERYQTAAYKSDALADLKLADDAVVKADEAVSRLLAVNN